MEQLNSPAQSSDQVGLSRVILRDVGIAAVLGFASLGLTYFSVWSQQRLAPWQLVLLPLVFLVVRVILRARVSVRYWPVELCAISLSVGYWCGFYLPLCLNTLLIELFHGVVGERHYVRLDGYVAILIIATAAVVGVLGFLVWRVEDRIRRNRSALDLI